VDKQLERLKEKAFLNKVSYQSKHFLEVASTIASFNVAAYLG
jgi:hypothetical protein